MRSRFEKTETTKSTMFFKFFLCMMRYFPMQKVYDSRKIIETLPIPMSGIGSYVEMTLALIFEIRDIFIKVCLEMINIRIYSVDTYVYLYI